MFTKLAKAFGKGKVSSWVPNEISEFSVSAENGFLPKNLPLEKLPERFGGLEHILQEMPYKKLDGTPGLLQKGEFHLAVDKLPEYDVADITDSALLMALFRDYTFAASAYLLEPCDISRRQTGKFSPGRKVLPRQIAVPLSKVAEKIGAMPYMEYAQSYALYNYKLKNPTGKIEYDNLQLIRQFSGMQSESGFILVHVDMVAHSKTLVRGVLDAFDGIKDDDRNAFNDALHTILHATDTINTNMEKMWKRSKPADYEHFRTYIMGTKNQKELFPDGVVYEGVSDEPVFYRGESGANDSIIPTLDNFVQLTEKMPDNEMTKILKDFRRYRPDDHNKWLSWVEKSADRLNVEAFSRKDPYSLGLYIGILEEIRNFRSRHWNFAKEYIIKRTKYPQATGGSPMATWLPNQLSVVLCAIEDNCRRMQKLQGYFDEDTRLIFNRATLQRKTLENDTRLIANGHGESVVVDNGSLSTSI